ncbi:class D beta-lactamase [Phyllobacterium sp. 628]|uniref:class D beta-lactamase n=1 Tax=Phyllobacterium sp. 628 TaxID=2718938 RepID=UPI0016628206|nr:class D beta-lactamase [Phyllobacterium sp. 628]
MMIGLGAGPALSQSRTICTVIADAATGNTVVRQGYCSELVTPASTFKIALSLMGYDSGFLKDAHTPELPYREGYADWGGENWRQTTDPERWMKYSVVWFSRQVTQFLGEKRLHAYARKFEYGNADVSGDPGKNNGLDRAWLSSSLKISPLEQVAFLRKFVNRQLPVTPQAYDMTNQIVEVWHLPNDWDVHGKTGTAFPRKKDGTPDEARAYGWFVGWAVKGKHVVVFARLIQDDKKDTQTAGYRARDAFLQELPTILDR